VHIGPDLVQVAKTSRALADPTAQAILAAWIN